MDIEAVACVHNLQYRLQIQINLYSVGERYFHSFHYISVSAETSLYQFQRVGLSASWSVGELVVGELDCRRLGLSASWIVGELVCRRVGCRRVSLSASCPVTVWVYHYYY